MKETDLKKPVANQKEGTANAITYNAGNDMAITLTKAIVEKNCAGGKSITDEDYTRFAALCKQHKLNPFTREAHIVVVTSPSGVSRASIMIGKDGYFKMADTNPDYDGMEDGVVVQDKDGNIQYLEGCFVPPGSILLAGWAKAYSKRKSHPKKSVCSLTEYKGSDKSLWGTKPATMINKVAKCSALRDLFPQTFNGTYDETEINNIKNEMLELEGTKETSATSTQAPVETTTEEMPALKDALEFVISNPKYKKICGHKLQELVDSKKANPLPALEALAKSDGVEGTNAKVVLDAIASGEVKIKFVEKEG